MTRKRTTEDEPTPRKKRLRTSRKSLPLPPCVLDAVRSVPGWAYRSSVTKPQPDGTLAITLRLVHRGGLVVDHAPFRAIANGYHVIRVHSHVARGSATVWLTLRPS